MWKEEPRRNGRHLVCLSESEKEAAAVAVAGAAPRLHRTRAPPLPAPSPDPSPPPRATHPSRLPAEIQVSSYFIANKKNVLRTFCPQ